ncbi:CD5 antigen-like, partial [Trematomus bernacchii]|uniref:CD5 antigen-like n=1 Tax=Trematomus bernacchii TaxID=40690 RepID=UPI00146A363C
MDHMLLLMMLLLCSSGLQAEGEHNSTGLQAEGEHNSTEPGVRLVGGESRCAGDLELEHEGEWRPVYYDSPWTLKAAGVACRDLDCGSAVSVGEREESSERSVWRIRPDCVQSGSALRECAASTSSSSFLNLTCSGKPIRDIVYDIMSSVSLL